MLHWIYPRLCELCHRPSEQELCPECAELLPRVPLPICLYCGAPVAGEQVDPYECAACRARPRSFDFARSALVSSEPALQLIYRLKYHRANYLAAGLAELLNRLWEDTPALNEAAEWALVPVPAGRKHLFRRGYNQAEELARALAKLRRLPLANALERRTTSAESQTRLSATERWQNALASYAVRRPWAEGRKSLGPYVALVEDVYTTGATTRACARALKQLPGVRRVGVITLLRAMRREI